MAQFSDQTDLHTDAYSSTLPQVSTKPTMELTKDKKKMMAVSAAALLLGGAAWAIKQRIDDQTTTNSQAPDTTESNPPELASLVVNLPTDVDVAKGVNDGMSFDEAFTTAREEVGIGGVFNWCGHIYNTFLKEEWSDLSLEQRIDYSEMITGEELTVKPAPTKNSPTPVTPDPIEKPTVIEGNLNGHRVMGLDFDQDGVIDTLLMDAEDGYTYRVVDATGDEGLDTIYKYDSLDGEWVMVQKIEQPVVLSNDDFSQGLEESMSREVVDSILESETLTTESAAVESAAVESVAEEPATDDELKMPEDDETIYLADYYHSEDDTYVNNGDVRDMDE